MNDSYRYNRDNAIRNPGTTTVKEAINRLLKHYQLQSRFNETYLEAFWAKMMGSTIASRTTRLYVKERILYIEITSAPLRNELVNAKHKMVARINEDIGTSVIDDVVFI